MPNAGDWRNAFGRGVFPARFAWILELRWRRLVLSPDALAARLPLDGVHAALEIGVGSGVYGQAVARKVGPGRLTVLDLQPSMLARCRERWTAPSAAYVAADATILPFLEESFDLIYMVTVFGEIHDRGGCLRAIRRCLKPHGVLSISEHLPDPDFTPANTLREIVEREGFALRSRVGPFWSYTADFRVNRATGTARAERIRDPYGTTPGHHGRLVIR